MLRIGILSRFLKKAEFLSEIGKPLLPSSLRNLGAVFVVVVSGIYQKLILLLVKHFDIVLKITLRHRRGIL